ncbi:YjbH domain-containing protein [Thalassotalea ponticola]|uniref:YjbH domain-containing protein n=1 Tax=Thalassotalea ponticola TaxID=1523392 RepID=UPI0025B41721|nr:YjbH domain-containing protein [Thalassotalea ponticola]MDN3652670.1 YjbH domain-containing protein [Thalassotalea ponticola]
MTQRIPTQQFSTKKLGAQCQARAVKAALVCLLSVAAIGQVVKAQTANDMEVNSEAPSTPLTGISTNLSAQAYTGLFNTPNAQTLDWGSLGFNYSDSYFDKSTSFIEQPGFVRAHDMKFSAGILPGVEVTGRLGTRSIDCNMYRGSNCGFRDLSAALKWQLPFLPKAFDDFADVAIGIQDVGGASKFSETYYISADKSVALNRFGTMRFSAGVGMSDNALGWMNGLFAGVEYQVVDNLQLVAEYDAHALNVGVKAYAPQSWLPAGWQVSGSVQLHSSAPDHNEHDQWFSLGVRIPLTSNQRSDASRYSRTAAQSSIADAEQGEVAKKPAEERNRVPLANSNGKRDQACTKCNNVQGAGAEQLYHGELAQLSDALQRFGFDSISLGLHSQGGHSSLLISVENNVLNHDESQALAVIQSLAAKTTSLDFSIRLLNHGLPVFTEQPQLWQQPSQIHWQVVEQQPARWTPRLIFSPALSSLVGTEAGAWDYQWALSSNLIIDMWLGAVADVRHLSNAIAESDDFEYSNAVQRRFGLPSGIDRALFHQALIPTANFAAQLSVGQFEKNMHGLLVEGRWQSINKKHRVSVFAGDFDSELAVNFNQKASHQPALFKYRYRIQSLHTDIELTAGEYVMGDQGYSLKTHHWFNNVQVGLKYQRSQFSDLNVEEDFIGIGITLPLSFTKSMHPKYGFQLRGIERWHYFVQTSVNRPGEQNLVRTQFGQEPVYYHNLNNAYFNGDRL